MFKKETNQVNLTAIVTINHLNLKMNCQLLTLIVAASTLLSAVNAAYVNQYNSNKEEQKSAWDAYKLAHNKTYNTIDLEYRRFYLFHGNMKNIDNRNEAEISAGNSPVHGVTKYLDLTDAEYKATLLKAIPPTSRRRLTPENSITSLDFKLQNTLVDWTGVYTTPVKDQVKVASIFQCRGVQ